MSAPPLQFAHANSFPAASYRVFLTRLAERFDVRFVPKFGHDPRYPVTESWPHLVEQLIDAVARGPVPVIGVGHSLGGYLSLLAAVRRPELFRAVILLDAPLIGTFHGHALALVKQLGLLERFSPGAGALGRRSEWPTVEAALTHFGSKRVFARFDPRSLEDYVRHATEATEHGVRLAFRPEVEHRIYGTLPHRVGRAAKSLRVPGGLIVGRQSDIVRRFGLAPSRRILRVVTTPGGHLFPLEHPEAAAEAVMEMAQNLGSL